jgi:hypothetical protein
MLHSRSYSCYSYHSRVLVADSDSESNLLKAAKYSPNGPERKRNVSSKRNHLYRVVQEN